MDLPERKLHRLKNYDYGNGYFFVTICTNDKKKLLCDIVGNDALVVPSELGKYVIDCWENIAKLNNNIEIIKYIMMPNHIHGIISIKNYDYKQNDDGIVNDKKYGFEITERRGRRSLQGLIKDFKSVTTRIYKKEFGGKESLWQKSYYDEIIKCDEHFQYAWQYIDENPRNWNEDKCF